MISSIINYGTSRPIRLTIFAVFIVLLYLLRWTDKDLLLTRLNQLDIEVEWRERQWDGKDTLEEILCRAQHAIPATDKPPIPNIVHFIHLSEDGDAEIRYSQYLAIKSAILRMGADEIRLHSFGIAENDYWAELKEHVTLVIRCRECGLHPQGRKFETLNIMHRADIIRLELMLEHGGIYLDTDVYVLKPFTELLSSPRDVLMGHEGGNRYGLCNAVIIARPQSEFIQLWQAAYQDSFDPSNWNHHSVRIPKQLQVQHGEMICPLSPSVFFWPTWGSKDVQYMHEPETEEQVKELKGEMEMFGGVMYENQLAFHAWGARDYLVKLTEEDVLERDTRFNVLVREIARAELPPARDQPSIRALIY